MPATTSAGVRIDFLFASFHFEKIMVDRAVMKRLGDTKVRVASLEDLILLKLPSPREKDASDIRMILDTYSEQIDWGYLSTVAKELAAAIDDPSILRLLQPKLR